MGDVLDRVRTGEIAGESEVNDVSANSKSGEVIADWDAEIIADWGAGVDVINVFQVDAAAETLGVSDLTDARRVST